MVLNLEEDPDQRRDRHLTQKLAEIQAWTAVLARRSLVSLTEAKAQVFDDLLADDLLASDRAQYSAAVRAWLRIVLFGDES